MTDHELLDAGERLYKAFLGSNLTFLELAGLAAARERRTSWGELGQNLKLAVFRLVVLSQPETGATETQMDSRGQPQPGSADLPSLAPTNSAPPAEPLHESDPAAKATEGESRPTASDSTDSGDGSDL